MGVLYLAEQVSIQRKVALKILNRQYTTNEEFIKRFHREARLAAGLNHRNIVTILDFDRIEDGTLFIAMEYVDGKTLRQLIKQEGPLEIAKAIRLGIQLAEGLAAAHRSGVIHRDIKPENIMIVGEREVLKIMDFGIARSLDANAPARLTRADAIMGTPEYMAPEQVDGEHASEKSDIYACGVVLYEMLTGNVPLLAPTPGATLLKQVNATPVPLRKLRNEIPVSIERVVMQALEKKTEKRQQSISEVADELKKATLLLEEKPPTTTLFATQAIDTAGLHRSRFGWKVVTGISLAVVISAGYLLFVTGSTPVVSAPTVSTSPSEITSMPIGEVNNSVDDPASAEEKKNSEPEKPVKAETPPVPAQGRTAAAEGKQAQAKKTPVKINTGEEISQAIDNKKRIDDALQRLEERKKRDQKPPPLPLQSEAQKPKPEASPPSPPVQSEAEKPKASEAPPSPKAPAVNAAELARIRGLVEQKLRNQGLLKVGESDRWGVTVEASGTGVVTLRGLLRDQKLREDAIRLAREVPGVSDVQPSIKLPGFEEAR
jgi:serine/threonine protein kinase